MRTAITFLWMTLSLMLCWATPAIGADLACTTQGKVKEIVPNSTTINRETPLGHPLTQPLAMSSDPVTCRYGTQGEGIQLVATFPQHLNPRANPYGDGILLDSQISGIGFVVKTQPVQLTTQETIVADVVRGPFATQNLGTVRIESVYAIKIGPIDLTRDTALHDTDLVSISWRPRDNPAAQEHLSTIRLRALPLGGVNVFAETCSFGGNPQSGLPEHRVHDLNPVSRAAFSGPGSESTVTIFQPMILSCRKFHGGHLSIESTTARAGMPGVVESIQGAGMATGVGLIIREGVGGAPWNFTERRLLASASGGDPTFFINYATNYVQTEQIIEPGRIQAIVTMTVTYD